MSCQKASIREHLALCCNIIHSTPSKTSDHIVGTALQDVPDPVMPPASSGGDSAEVVPPTASDPDTKAQVDAAIARVRRLATGQLKLDPDQAEPSNQAMGDTAASQGRAASDALAMMPAIPASTSGLVSPDDVSAQHQSGYGGSSSSDSESESDAAPADETKGQQLIQQVYRALHDRQADAEAHAAAADEAKQASSSSTSSLPSSSTSEDENQAQQQSPAPGEGDVFDPANMLNVFLTLGWLRQLCHHSCYLSILHDR